MPMTRLLGFYHLGLTSCQDALYTQGREMPYGRNAKKELLYHSSTNILLK